MKAHLRTLAAALSLTALSTTTAGAQSSQFIPAVEPGPDNFMSSTVAEGYLTGLARYIRAMGQFNLNTAQGRKLNEDAREHYIQNSVTSVTAYFDRRQINRERRREMAPTPLSQSQLDEVMRSKAPNRLTPSQLDHYTGAIRWPEALEYPWFDQQRRQMEPLFASWAQGQGGSGTRLHGKVVELAGQMVNQLRANIKKVDSHEAIAARKFIDGLRYEAQLSPQEVARTLEVTQYQFAGGNP